MSLFEVVFPAIDWSLIFLLSVASIPGLLGSIYLHRENTRRKELLKRSDVPKKENPMPRDKDGLEIDKYALELFVERGNTLTAYLVNDENRIKKLYGPLDDPIKILQSLGYVRGFLGWWEVPIYFTFSNLPDVGVECRLGVIAAQNETEERRIDQRLAPWRGMFGKP